MSLLSALSRTPQPPAADAGAVPEVDLTNFVAEVIEGSRERLVVVDFWSVRSTQSKQFSPMLEKVVRATNGAVRLVKTDIDKNPEIAQQLRIQSVPAVFAFFRGQPVDGFMGALPEAQIKAWLDRLMKGVGAEVPDAGGLDTALAQAAEFLAKGDTATAQSIYADILEMEPLNVAAYAGTMRCLIALGDSAQAKQMLEITPPDIAKDKAFDSVRTAIELAEQAGKTGSAAELAAKLAQNPADHQARFDLALAHYAAGQKEKAVDELLELVRRDRAWDDSAARKQLVKLFEAFGAADPLTISARKRLSSILFS
jgi:putative thioredoxin